MTTTTTFVGYAPEHPEGRCFSHWQWLIPLRNRIQDQVGTGDLLRFVNCLQEVDELLLLGVDWFTNHADPDLATDADIEAMLYDVGNPFDWIDLDLTANQKRRLLRVLVDIYKLKGTDIGIESVVFFLLGKVVHVVDYISEGWVLGEDILGEYSIAEIVSLGGELFKYNPAIYTWPLDLKIKVDGGTEQTIIMNLGDVVNPNGVTAEEIVTVINAQLTGGKAVVRHAGVTGNENTNPEPFALFGGETLILANSGGTPQTITFHASDFSVPGVATAAEVAARIEEDFEGGGAVGWLNPFTAMTRCTIFTGLRGALESLDVIGGTAVPALGVGVNVYNGTDAANVAIYSLTAGPDAEIQVTGGWMDYGLLFWMLPDLATEGTGSTVLAPDDLYTLYSFDIVSDDVLTSEEEDIVRRIAEYMKPAHTHLVNIRTDTGLPWPQGWELGESALDEGTELT